MSSHDTCIDAQHEAVHLTSDFGAEDQQYVDQDDNDVISVARYVYVNL